MKRLIAILCALPGAAFSEPGSGRPDLLRFTNGDQLHGSFAGVRDGSTIQWRRDDLSDSAGFGSGLVRQIVLRGATAVKPAGPAARIELVNGDLIPGRVTRIDEKTITLESPGFGTANVARGQVVSISPNPLGGRVRYFGPFDRNDWKMAHPSFPGGLPDAPAADASGGKNAENDDQPGRWEFSGAAWYWPGKGAASALVRESGMPTRASLSFNLAWKNQLALVIGFHADFKTPPPRDKEVAEEPDEKPQIRRFVQGDTSMLPLVFGNSNAIQIFSNYIQLIRTRVDKDGKTSCERSQVNHEGLRLGDKSRVHVEIRSDRASGETSMFIDGEFVGQWNGYSEELADVFKSHTGATGFGFVPSSQDLSIRISDVVVSEWNGMPDSARSMNRADKDVVLMANGTDRFAGKVTGMDPDSRVLFESGLGKFELPLEEVSEIRFATASRSSAPEPPSGQWAVRFGPAGSLTGKPLDGDASTLRLESPILGPLKVSLDSALLIDLNPSNLTIDDWETDL